MRIRKYPPNTLLYVRWEDIQADCAWTDNEEARKPEPAMCWTVGHYSSHDKENLVLAGTLTSGQRDKVTIPVGVIRGIDVLMRWTPLNKLTDDLGLDLEEE